MSLYDRPNLQELIDAARMHLETTIIPLVKGDPKVYFQTLVAINVLKIATREISLEWTHLLSAWESLNALDGINMPLPSDADAAHAALTGRQDALCAAIRSGAYDERADPLLDHLLRVTRAQLQVANPKYLEGLDAEDTSSAHGANA